MTGLVYPVILAAGGSSRLGRPKQLLEYKGRTLLENAVCAAREFTFSFSADIERATPLVVLGANAGAIVAATDLSEVDVVKNENWQAGMASSIKIAVNHIAAKNSAAAGILFLLADQPHLSAQILLKLLHSLEQDCGRDLDGCPQTIVASKFENSTLGPPVYFGRYYFDELLALEGDIGARKVLEANRELVRVVDFTFGAIDIDTQEDYKKLLANIDA